MATVILYVCSGGTAFGALPGPDDDDAIGGRGTIVCGTAQSQPQASAR
jgi:hypothetical protein